MFLSFRLPSCQVPATGPTTGNQISIIVSEMLLLHKASPKLWISTEKEPWMEAGVCGREGAPRGESGETLETRWSLAPGLVSPFPLLSPSFRFLWLCPSVLLTLSSLQPSLHPASSLPPPCLPVPGPRIWEPGGGNGQEPLHQQQPSQSCCSLQLTPNAPVQTS